jgi:hypothetical protein
VFSELRQRNDILQGIANNPQADYKARVEAHHLAGEITALILKMHLESPSLLAQRHQFPNTSSMPLAEQQGNTGIKLII